MNWLQIAKLSELKPSRNYLELTEVTKTAGIEEYSKALEGLAQSSTSAKDLFEGQKLNPAVLNSLFLGTDGKFHLLHSHQHDATTGKIMKKVHPEEKAPGNPKSKGGGWNHWDLTMRSGIMRVQIYQNRVACSVEMSAPPNLSQLMALRNAYEQTNRGGFVAEINWKGKTVAHITSFPAFVNFINEFSMKPEDFQEDPTELIIKEVERANEAFSRANFR